MALVRQRQQNQGLAAIAWQIAQEVGREVGQEARQALVDTIYDAATQGRSAIQQNIVQWGRDFQNELGRHATAIVRTARHSARALAQDIDRARNNLATRQDESLANLPQETQDILTRAENNPVPNPEDADVPDLEEIMPQEQQDEPMEMATMSRQAGPSGSNQVAKETPIIIATPSYGLQETHTTILPWTGYITAAGLNKRTPQQLKIRMNTPWDMLDATTNEIGSTDGAYITTKGLYNRQIDTTGKFSTSNESRYPVELPNNATTANERPAWRDYWSRLYEYYTVLGCEYEIILYNPVQVKDVRLIVAQEQKRFVTGPTTHTFPAIQQFIDCGYYNSDCVCAIQYDTYSSTATSTGNVMPTTNYEEIRAYPGIKWYPIKGGQKQVIKGTYRPGQAKRNVVNDGDVKTWTKTSEGVPTSLSEILTLNFFMDPFFNARQQDRYFLNAAGDVVTNDAQATGSNIRGAVNMEINLKYIVQFKDLRQQARYPNTITTDQDVTQILNESIGASGSALQSWGTATAPF